MPLDDGTLTAILSRTHALTYQALFAEELHIVTHSTSQPAASTSASTSGVDTAAIRDILTQQGRLSVSVDSLTDESCLYTAGLTSLATVGVMLALEDHFDVEFPESKLSRTTFRSISSIAETVAELVG